MKPLFGLEGTQKAWGFVGSEVTFSGSELGGSQEDVKVILREPLTHRLKLFPGRKKNLR